MTNQEKLEKQLNEVIKSNRKKLVEMNATEYELTAYDWNTADLKEHILKIDECKQKVDELMASEQHPNLGTYKSYLHLREWCVMHKSKTCMMLTTFLFDMFAKKFDFDEEEVKLN